MELLSQEQRLAVRDLCRVIVRRNAEQSVDKVLQQLKSEYCCRECVMDEAKKYAHAKRNPTLLLYYDSTGAVSPGANVLQKPTVLLRTNRNLDWTREAECSTSSSDPPFNYRRAWWCGLAAATIAQ